MTLFWKMLYIVKIFVNFYEVILYKLDKCVSVCIYIPCVQIHQVIRFN